MFWKYVSICNCRWRCYFRNAMYFKYKSKETRHNEGKYNIYTLNYIQLYSCVTLWSHLVLQSFYFQCNWWRLFQKPVVCLRYIYILNVMNCTRIDFECVQYAGVNMSTLIFNHKCMWNLFRVYSSGKNHSPSDII
jgi:hypothetical protein